jgi:hypothetical protein
MTKTATPEPHQLTGPRARYRGKDRARVLTFALTPAGNAALAARLAATGLSRSDYLESLIRADVLRAMQTPEHTEN